MSFSDEYLSSGRGQYKAVLYFPAYKTHRPIRCTIIFSLEILEKNYVCMYFNFSNLLE
jgi:hypothetical protein